MLRGDKATVADPKKLPASPGTPQEAGSDSAGGAGPERAPGWAGVEEGDPAWDCEEDFPEEAASELRAAGLGGTRGGRRAFRAGGAHAQFRRGGAGAGLAAWPGTRVVTRRGRAAGVTPLSCEACVVPSGCSGGDGRGRAGLRAERPAWRRGQGPRGRGGRPTGLPNARPGVRNDSVGTAVRFRLPS